MLHYWWQYLLTAPSLKQYKNSFSEANNNAFKRWSQFYENSTKDMARPTMILRTKESFSNSYTMHQIFNFIDI